MFTIKVDGQDIYNPALFDERYQVINPELTLEVNKAGSLTFTMPPCNAMWGSLNKLTSIITVEQDGDEIFRGRVMNDETDTWKQRSVYVEGELAFLLDSIQRPYEFSGNAVDLFKQLITDHNEIVNEEKQFTIGNITAVDENTEAEIDTSSYSDTFSEIEDRLLNAYGGYIRIRHEDGISYIDYLSKSGDDNTQPIQLGVNLLDLKESITAEDVFTVLIPTGAMQNGDDGKFSELLTISEANNGLDYLEDEEAIAKYGRIWKRKHWDNIEDPTELKEQGEEYLATGITEDATLTITAVDMHFVDPEKQRIAIGDMVQIFSDPHGLDQTTICYKIVMPLQEPERTVYTFGEPERTLTDNVVRTEEATGGGGGGQTTEEEVQDIIRWAYAKADQDEAKYDILTGELNNVTGELSQANIRLDGVEATIQLKADSTTVEELRADVDDAAVQMEALTTRVSQAEVNIDGANAAIALKASQEEVTELSGKVEENTTRLSAAEIAIDGANAAIALKASQTTVDELGERVSAAEASILVNAESIESKVSKNGIISAINQTAESVKISASRIELDGETIVKVLTGAYVDVYSLNASEGSFGLLDATSLTADVINSPEAYFDALYIGNSSVADTSLTMGGLVSANVWGGGSAIDLSHSHKVTVNDDGTITLGEVSAEGGNFKIADTKAYKDGVSAAIDSVTVYKPFVTSTEHPGDSSKLMRVYMQAKGSNGAESEIASELISAAPVYDVGYSAGYNAGWAAAKAKVSLSDNVIYAPSDTVDSAEALYTVTAGGSINSITNTAANYFFAQGYGRAYINGTQVAYASINKTQQINVGQ